jgi:hypothetical protein
MLQHHHDPPPRTGVESTFAERMRARRAELAAEQVAKSREQRKREHAEVRIGMASASARMFGFAAEDARRAGDHAAARDLSRCALRSRRHLAALTTTSCATRPRARGAGRPRVAAARRSSTSRDDGSDGEPGEPDPPSLPAVAVEDARRVLARAARRLLTEAAS